MKSAIFYFSLEPGDHRYPVFDAEGKRAGYVRAEAFDGDLSDALDAAKPQDDESVMNTHSLDLADWTATDSSDRR